MLLVASGIFAMFFFNSLYIQRVLGFGPLEAGLAFLPFTAGIMVSAGLASKFSPKVGVRPVAIVGLVVSALGMLLLTRVPAEGSYPVDMLPALVLTVARHGRGVRAAHADRDDRPQERGPGARIRPLQHVAADRRRARARDPLDDRREPTEAAAASDAEALVTGFHWAFAGAAAFVLAGLVLLLVLLRKEDVAQISAEAGSGADRMTTPSAPTPSATSSACSRRPRRPSPSSGADVSVDEIARRAGVGHATVFRRFPTKDSLIAAVVCRRVDALVALRGRGARAARRGRGVPRVRVARGRDVRLRPRALRRARPLRRVRRSPRRRPSCTRSSQQLIARAQESGAVRADVGAEDVSLLVGSAIQATRQSADPDAWRRYLAVVLDGLRPPVAA